MCVFVFVFLCVCVCNSELQMQFKTDLDTFQTRILSLSASRIATSAGTHSQKSLLYGRVQKIWLQVFACQKFWNFGQAGRKQGALGLFLRHEGTNRTNILLNLVGLRFLFDHYGSCRLMFRVLCFMPPSLPQAGKLPPLDQKQDALLGLA